MQYFGDWWVDMIDLDGVERWQSTMVQTMSPPTVNGIHRVFRLILERAMHEKIIHRNPARAVPTLPESRTKGSRGQTYDPIDFQTFVMICETEAQKVLPPDVCRHLLLIAWTGMRLSESIALRWSDIEKGEIHIQRSVWRGIEKSTKTDDPRRVVIPMALREVLKAQADWLLETDHPGIGSGLVFPGAPRQSKGGMVRRKMSVLGWHRAGSTLVEGCAKIAAMGGLKPISPQGLRRTFEDLMREAGVEQMVRRAMSGWRTAKAQGIYATVKRTDREKAVTALEDLMTATQNQGKSNQNTDPDTDPKAENQENALLDFAKYVELKRKNGAGHEIRTRDFNLGKVALYH